MKVILINSSMVFSNVENQVLSSPFPSDAYVFNPAANFEDFTKIEVTNNTNIAINILYRTVSSSTYNEWVYNLAAGTTREMSIPDNLMNFAMQATSGSLKDDATGDVLLQYININT